MTCAKIKNDSYLILMCFERAQCDECSIQCKCSIEANESVSNVHQHSTDYVSSFYIDQFVVHLQLIPDEIIGTVAGDGHTGSIQNCIRYAIEKI